LGDFPVAVRRKTGGRKKGTPNKLTAQLKEAILEAAELAGKGEGVVGYLAAQAEENPSAFLSLLGKVLPLQVNGPGEGGAHIIQQIERVIVKATDQDA
jgi:hypothetical protein